MPPCRDTLRNPRPPASERVLCHQFMNTRTLGEDVHAIRHNVVQQTLIVGNDQKRTLRAAADQLTPVRYQTSSASISKPESVSSKIASLGSSMVICSTSALLLAAE